MSIQNVKADGTYWAVALPGWTWPCHFNPPANDLERVRRHWPQALQESRKISGAEFLAMADAVTAGAE